MGERFRTPARILADWRAALHRYETTPNRSERGALRATVERLRLEYHDATAQLIDADTEAHLAKRDTIEPRSETGDGPARPDHEPVDH